MVKHAYPATPASMAKIQKTVPTPGKDWNKRDSRSSLVGMQNCTATFEESLTIKKKLTPFFLLLISFITA